MANELAKMSLKQATPLQSSFTPFQYTPKPLDTTGLERSLDKIEARETYLEAKSDFKGGRQ